MRLYSDFLRLAGPEWRAAVEEDGHYSFAVAP